MAGSAEPGPVPLPNENPSSAIAHTNFGIWAVGGADCKATGGVGKRPGRPHVSKQSPFFGKAALSLDDPSVAPGFPQFLNIALWPFNSKHLPGGYKVKNRILILSLLLSSVSAHGFSPAFSEKNSSSFFKSLVAEKQRKSLREKCLQEAEKQRFPLSCMLLVRQQSLFFSTRQQWEQVWKSMSHQCLRSVERVSSQKVLEKALLETALGSACRAQVRSRLADLEYMEKNKERGGLGPILEI